MNDDDIPQVLHYELRRGVSRVLLGTYFAHQQVFEQECNFFLFWNSLSSGYVSMCPDTCIPYSHQGALFLCSMAVFPVVIVVV